MRILHWHQICFQTVCAGNPTCGPFIEFPILGVPHDEAGDRGTYPLSHIRKSTVFVGTSLDGWSLVRHRIRLEATCSVWSHPV